MEQLNKLSPVKSILIAVVFASIAVYLAYIVPSVEIAWVCALLVLTIYLFAFEVVDIDIAAICIMVLLGLSSLFAPLMGLEQGLVSDKHLFDGFSSNAVMSIIAVMIIGAGLDKTGVMAQVSTIILSLSGKSEQRIVPILTTFVAFVSSFIQNIGVAALFIPVASRISSRTHLSMASLLMPVGFCTILGGTVTLVGSSPLILLNDLILASNTTLSPELEMHQWSLFSVTPIGLVLVIAGILYFKLLGLYVLPKTMSESATKASSTMDYFEKIYGIDKAVFELVVQDDSPMIGETLGHIENQYRVRAIGLKYSGQESKVGSGAMAYDSVIEAGMVLAVLGAEKKISILVYEQKLKKRNVMRTFADSLSSLKSGIAEVVIPPSSNLIGKTAREVWLRESFGFSLIAIHRNGTTYRQGENIRSMTFQSGDTLVGHIQWEKLARLQLDNNFIVVTTEFPHIEEVRTEKFKWAAIFFSISLLLIFFSDIHLSIALLTGAIGMILSGVIKMDEAYKAVSWKTVFLLASLIPLGIATETSGTAKWIAEQTLLVVGGMSVWVIQLAIAILATLFTLIMSNVGATVLLVPLAVNIAIGVEGADPAIFALTVALGACNSFILPTNQVNALIKGPAGYRVADFIKAGSGLSVIFLIIVIVMTNAIY